MPMESISSSGPMGMPAMRATFSIIAGWMPSLSIAMPSPGNVPTQREV